MQQGMMRHGVSLQVNSNSTSNWAVALSGRPQSIL